MSVETYKKQIIDLRARLDREKEAKKKDNEYYAPGGPITNATGIYILAGSGTTDPTKNDYTLENVVPLTHMNGSVTASSTSFLTVFRTLKNDSTEPVTISEVGLFCNIARDANAGARAVTLFAREVLTSSFALPITMNPEEAYTFTFAL